MKEHKIEKGHACCHSDGHSHSEEHTHEAHSHDGCSCSGEGGDASRVFWIRMGVGVVLFAVGLVLQFTKVLEPLVLLALYLPAYLMLGGDVVFRSVKNILRGKVFDENFLMTVATIGAFAIGESAEGVAVMLFYQVGETVQGMAVGKVRRSITSLLDIRPDYALLIGLDGNTLRVKPETVQVGERILVRPGEKIPLDGRIEEGESTLDTAMLTGESLPRAVRAGDEVLSGSVNQSGVLTIRTTAVFLESTASRMIQLTEQAAKQKARTERFITKFAKIYTPIVVLAALALAVVMPLLLDMSNPEVWTEWVFRALTFLVISCPCALVISIPLGFFGGIGGAARQGVLVKGGNYLELLSKVETVMFDKTGTLTKGVFEVTQLLPADGISDVELLEKAAVCESFSLHPIARSILARYEKTPDQSALTDYEEIAGKGVRVHAKTGELLAGNSKLLEEQNIRVPRVEGAGAKVYVAENGRYLGCIVVSDAVKPDAHAAVDALRARGVRVLMMTGDNPESAKALAKMVGIDEVYAGLLPHEKVEIARRVAGEKRKKGAVVFVGDGINDAPVLALSDVGIAMGALGSDAAIEAADAVIMTDEPSKIAVAQSVSRRTKAIVWQNIFFAFFVKLLFIGLGAFGIATLWEAVFADVGVALLAVLNSLRALYPKQEKR